MKKLLIGFLAVLSVSSYAQEIKKINEPGLANGLKVVGYPTSKKMKQNIQAYVNGVMACTYNYTCGELPIAKDNFSSKSDKDGICKKLGFKNALAHSSGDLINVFGKVLNVDSSGEIVSVQTKEATSMPNTQKELRKYFSRDKASRRTNWSTLEGAIDVMYAPVSKNVITSITCK